MKHLDSETRKKWVGWLTSGLGLLIFVAAAFAIRSVFKEHSFTEIAAEFGARSRLQLVSAFGLMVISYLVLTGYDLLGLKYIERNVPVGRAMLTSFLGYAFSNNLGFFGGAGLRLRRYLHLGLTSYEVGKLIAFSAFTFWIGFATLGGLIFALTPPPMAPDSWLTAPVVRALGILLLLIVALYLGQSRERWRDFSFRGKRYVLPNTKLRIGQILISCSDWIFAALVLYAVLPQTMVVGFAIVLAAFLCAQLLGLASNVPGGLGVFETVLLFVLPVGPGDEASILASLVLFRLIYFVTPLIAATCMTGYIELYDHFSTARGSVGP